MFCPTIESIEKPSLALVAEAESSTVAERAVSVAERMLELMAGELTEKRLGRGGAVADGMRVGAEVRWGGYRDIFTRVIVAPT